MDTRRPSELSDTASEPVAVAVDNEVEVLELSAIDRPRRVPVGRVAFVFLIALLAGLIALAGIPARSDFGFDRPLPNLFSTTQAR